jgi:hypothetical protein
VIDLVVLDVEEVTEELPPARKRQLLGAATAKQAHGDLLSGAPAPGRLRRGLRLPRESHRKNATRREIGRSRYPYSRNAEPHHAGEIIGAMSDAPLIEELISKGACLGRASARARYGGPLVQ